MQDQFVGSKAARDAIASAIGTIAGAVADPKGALRRLKSALSSPKPLMISAGLVAAYVLGWCRGHRSAVR